MHVKPGPASAIRRASAYYAIDQSLNTKETSFARPMAIKTFNLNSLKLNQLLNWTWMPILFSTWLHERDK